MRSHLPVSLPENNDSASPATFRAGSGCSLREFVTQRTQFLFGGCKRSLTKTSDGKHSFVAAVESFKELTKVLNASLLQCIGGARGKSQFFDWTFGRTLQLFLDLLLLNIGLAGRKLLVEAVYLAFDVKES